MTFDEPPTCPDGTYTSAMPMPRLPLRSWTGGSLSAHDLPGDGSVLWLDGPDSERVAPFVGPLRRALGPRLWSPAVRTVPLPGPPPGRNPWAHRQDRQAPLRWGDGDGDEGSTELAPLRLERGELDGLVLVGACVGRTDQEVRTLLRQVVALLRSEAPWILVEPNGRALHRIARSFRATDSQRGEGRGTVRSIEELRRLLETGGLGLAGAWAVPPRRRRDAFVHRLLGRDSAADWMFARGTRIR